ncbi:YfcE family phosphodiesterase [Levilactobacillus spicheri]
MARWLVISDNHGDREILPDLRRKLRPDVTFHCGDSEMTADDPWFLAPNTYVVRGNMDIDDGFPLALTPKIDGAQVLLTHGHRDAVHWDLTKLQLHAEAVQADAVFFGHTHELAVEMTGGRLYLNPGSISQPRGEFRSLGGTCALVTVTPEQWLVQYYTRDGRPVTRLKFSFERPQKG